MAKKVIGILLVVLGALFLLMAANFLLVFGGVGIAFNLGSDNVANSSFIDDATTVSCMGQVVDVSDSQTTIYYTVDGATYEVSYSVTNSSYPTGTSVVVYYDQTDPSRCEVPEVEAATFGIIGKTFTGLAVALPIVFGILGLGCLVGGILLIRSSKKQVQDS